MSKKIQRPISILTSITTIAWLSGIAMLAPLSVGAAVVDGDIVSPDVEFTEGDITYYPYDVFIVKIVGSKTFKRLILNPEVFDSYGHLEWGNIQTISASTVEGYTTSDLVRADGDTKVYQLTADGDTGTKGWVNMTAADFESEGYDWDSIYVVNDTDRDNYTTGSDVTTGEVAGVSEGTLTVTLAADTPAAGIAVESAARLAFTKVNLTASGGDVIVDSLVVERTGLANDACITSLDLIDAGTNLPINITSKTLNSLHQTTFNDDFTVSNGTTKSVILAANMPASEDSYSGETPSLSLDSVTLKDDATLSAALPITGNTMTINHTITIGTATVQRGAYTNATSTAIQVGKEDYTFFSFQIQAGSNEKIKFSQIKIYQEGSASLGTDLVNLELLQDGTKIADGVVASSKYVNFSFDAITLTKGQTVQFQVKADVEDGSARTIILGIYKTTDLLVEGITYGYNITPSYSGTGSSASNPVLRDNQFTISNGTLQVTRSNDVGAENIGVANDQYLGAFNFTCKGESISVSELVLTVTSTGDPGNASDAVLNVELIDPSGNVVAGPTDPVRATGVVTWTDTFTVPIGETVYKVRGDLQTSASWASNDTVYVSFTPSAMTSTGDITGNAISETPSSAVSGNTQTVKAATLTVTRNTLPADQYIIVDQKDVTLSSWSFDATDSGEDIRVTSIGFTAVAAGSAATNTNALTVYADGVAQSPVNDAIADDSTGAFDAASSTFAFESPIVITKGTSIDVELHGDKDTVVSNDTENWGLRGDCITTYGVTTGNTVTEDLTEDDGPTLTSAPKGTLIIETSGNPVSALVLAGTTGNVFTNVKLSAKYEDLRLDQLVVHIGDGEYEFNTAESDYYNDVTNVAIYEGTTLLGQNSIPSTNKYTFNFDADTLTIPKGGSKTLTVKADMATIDPDTNNAPGTNSSDLDIGFGGTDGVKTTGKSSNSEITGSSYETYRSSTSSAMVLRTSKPIVTLPTSSDSLGAATSLTNGSIVLYAFKVTADASGGDVMLYRVTFGIATSGDNMTIVNLRIDDEDGNTVGAASTPGAYDSADLEAWDTFTFDNPGLSVDDATEAIKIASGDSATFKVYGTIGGAGANENFTTFLAGDTASTSAEVNTHNYAVATNSEGWIAPDGDLSDMNNGNFIWSDNYKNYSISGTDGNNATSVPQWYNGHLVSGLGNVVSTTGYVIAY